MAWLRTLAPVVLLAACAGGGSPRPPAAAVGLPPAPPAPGAGRTIAGVLRTVLPNGLTVVIEPVHGRPVVGISLSAIGGSRDETPSEEGGAHFLEHMFYMGTPTRKARQIRDDVMNKGGQSNALTEYDRTEYWAVVRSECFEMALDGIADSARNVLLAPEEVEKERATILDEIRQRLDEPQLFVQEEMEALAYHPHPYARRRAGTEASVRRMSRDDLVRIHQRDFRPDKLVLCLTGDVDAEQALASVRAKFGTMTAEGPPPPRGENAPPARGFERAVFTRDLEQAYVCIGAPAPGVRHPDQPAVDCAAQMLLARLYTALVLEKKLATSVVGGAGNQRDLGVLKFLITPVRPELASACEHEALVQFAETAKIPTGRTDWDEEAELANYQRTLRLSVGLSREDTHARLNLLVWGEVLGSLPHLHTYEERVDAVTLADVGRVMRTWAGADQLNVVVVGPAAASAPSAADSKRQAALDALAFPVPPPDHTAVVDPAAALDRWTEHRLPNGLRVVVRPDPTFDLVSVGLFSAGGAEQDPPGAEGRANLALRMLLMGAAAGRRADGTGDDAWDRQRFSKVIYRLGGSFAKASGRELGHHLVTVTRADLEAAVNMLAAGYTRPTFPEGDLAAEQAQIVGELRAEGDQLWGVAFRHARRLIYGEGHPYTLDERGTEASVGRLGRDDILAGARAYFRPDRSVLVLHGAVTAREARELALGAFGRWAAPADGDAPAVAAPVPPPGPASVGEFEFPLDREQAYVIVAVPAPPHGDPDHTALEFATTVCSLRCFREIIYDQKIGYSAGAVRHANRAGGAIFLYVHCTPARLDDAKAELKRLVHRLITAPIDADEFEKTRQGILGQRPIQMQRGAARVSEVGLSLAYGLPADHRERQLREIAALTPDAVRAAARRVFDPERLTVVVVRRPTGGPR